MCRCRLLPSRLGALNLFSLPLPLEQLQAVAVVSGLALALLTLIPLSDLGMGGRARCLGNALLLARLVELVPPALLGAACTGALLALLVFGKTALADLGRLVIGNSNIGNLGNDRNDRSVVRYGVEVKIHQKP
jgi:hypothetical protein